MRDGVTMATAGDRLAHKADPEIRCGTCVNFERALPVCIGCTEIGTPVYRKWEPMDNAPMPLSSKEKQEAFRARNAMLGLTEVRGIYLPPEKHAELKEMARKLLEAAQKS